MKSRIQVPTRHYFNMKYDTKSRWVSYWYQINEVVSLQPKSVLEIGVGNKTVSDYLTKIGIRVRTCDFDKSLNPDVAADIRKLPFRQDSYDVVLCAEVLEHLPFKYFRACLREIYRVTKKSAIITLPHFSLTNLYFGFKLIPFIPKKEFSLNIDSPNKHIFEGEHYWEIGKKGFPISLIKEYIQNSDFKIKKTYSPIEDPRHNFFILEK